MIFHVVALPHTTTSKEYNACAYTQKVYNFCKMMMARGHTVYHYGTKGSTVPCTEHITIITPEEQAALFGSSNWRQDFFSIVWDVNEPYWVLHNQRAAAEINKRKHKKDFLCLIGGVCQKPIADLVGLDVQTVEYGIGYTGVFAKYRVFESYAHMHHLYGQLGIDDGGWYDVVIPNYYDPADFPVQTTKSDYFLFIGRLIKRKGAELAAQITQAINAPLIMAGQGVLEQSPGKIVAKELTIVGDNVTHVGYADVDKRAELMGKAKAVICPTYYIGPFEGVNVEAQLCGTPVITTDWGAFTETVEHGVTGYRCRTFEQFTYAARELNNFHSPAYYQRISDLARANYALDRVGKMYEEYFNMVYDLWGAGWYTEKKRPNIDWLNKTYGTMEHSNN